MVEGQNSFLQNHVLKQSLKKSETSIHLGKISSIIIINKGNVNMCEWVNGAYHSAHYTLISHPHSMLMGAQYHNVKNYLI